jgi:glycosyltransferase involved in cell wall biosynthesis
VGANIAGYFTTESGVGEGARMLARSMECARIPRELYNFDKSGVLPRGDDTFRDFSAENPHPVNIVRVNADQVPLFSKEVGEEYFKDRYNIGFWAWELSEFPEQWNDRFAQFDEIWAPSTFCAEAIAANSPVPVQRMPHSINPAVEQPLRRSQLALPEDRFLFLFVFDYMSFFERKNPLAVIRAFRDAFGGGGHAGVSLVIKSSNGGHFPEQVAHMREEAADLPIEFIDSRLARNEVRNLLRLCDCYVSLHRSEGFGLTMAEAMVFAKPVIATGYSGNTDYMNANNSLLVGHRLTEIEEDVGPYQRGQVWADPDLEQAARHMRFVLERRAEAEELGWRAHEYVRENLSPERIGARIRRRLELVLAAGKR